MVSSLQRAFTLIELLTVIAILGILSGLLIPVLNGVRQRAAQAECASNLRQLGLAVLNYETDHNELPGPVRPAIRHPSTNPDDERNLPWVLRDYLGRDDSIWNNRSSEEARNATANQYVYLLNNKGTTDPPFFFGSFASAVTTAADPLNKENIRAAGESPPDDAVRGLSRIWMASNIDSLNYGPDVAGVQAPLPNDIEPPHNGGRNYVFFDGHVEFRRSGNWPANP